MTTLPEWLSIVVPVLVAIIAGVVHQDRRLTRIEDRLSEIERRSTRHRRSD